MLHELHLDRTIVQANRYNGKYFTCSVQKNNCLMNRKRVHELRTRDVVFVSQLRQNNSRKSIFKCNSYGLHCI